MSVKIKDKKLRKFIWPDYVVDENWCEFEPHNEVCPNCFTEISWNGAGCWCSEQDS